MAVLAKDFLRLAEALLNGPERTEMDLRTAAARAYYAVMHLVRMELGLSVDDSTHALIRDEMYRMPPARTPPFLGMAKREWDSLWARRRRADYKIDGAFTLADARASVTAERLIFDARGRS